MGEVADRDMLDDSVGDEGGRLPNAKTLPYVAFATKVGLKGRGQTFVRRME